MVQNQAIWAVQENDAGQTLYVENGDDSINEFGYRCIDKSDAKDIEGVEILRNSDGNDSSGEEGDGEFDQVINVDMAGDDMSIQYDDDYYQGSIKYDDEDVTWDYRRTGATSLVTSAVTIASVAATLY